MMTYVPNFLDEHVTPFKNNKKQLIGPLRLGSLVIVLYHTGL